MSPAFGLAGKACSEASSKSSTTYRRAVSMKTSLGPVSTSSVHAMLVHAIAHAAEHAGQAELTRDLIEERA